MGMTPTLLDIDFHMILSTPDPPPPTPHSQIAVSHNQDRSRIALLTVLITFQGKLAN